MSAAIDDLPAFEISRPFRLLPNATGRPWVFQDIVNTAGIRNVTTGGAPIVLLHQGEDDFIAVSPGRKIYCLSEPRLKKLWLGADNRETAHLALYRLAYGAFDWASREIVAADNKQRRGSKRGRAP